MLTQSLCLTPAAGMGVGEACHGAEQSKRPRPGPCSAGACSLCSGWQLPSTEKLIVTGCGVLGYAPKGLWHPSKLEKLFSLFSRSWSRGSVRGESSTHSPAAPSCLICGCALCLAWPSS